MKSRVAAFGVALFLSVSTVTTQERVLVLEGATLIDGTGKTATRDAVVVVDGTRIKAVGTRGQVPYPPNATVLRLEGRTLLPGFIDGHVHLREWQLPMFLPYGVTTIADIHNDTAWSLVQRDALKNGHLKGPRMFVSGARVSGPLGTATPESTIVRTVDEARAYVRNLAAAGVDLIKVDLTITDDQLRAVIEEAAAAKLKVVGHTQNIRKAAELGFKHMEHTDTMARALLEAEPEKLRAAGSSPEAVVDPRQFPPLIDYLVEQGVYVNPTLVLFWASSTERWRDWTRDAARMVNDPGLAFVPADAKAAWLGGPRFVRQGYNNIASFLRQYSEAGGRILAASDTGCCPEVIPGLSLHYEMQMLTDLGVAPMKAIQGATLWAAEVIGQAKDLGSIEPGKLADFVVIEGNPLIDISATKNVRMVIKNGEVVDTAYDPTWVNPIPRPFAPAPQITRLIPGVVSQGSPTTTLQLEGTGFSRTSVVRLDNTDLPTTFVSSTRLTATLETRFLHAVGTYAVYVVNTGVGGNLSRASYFMVNFKN
jgi:imidazolonepropionase-like amidohydrolase